MSISPNLLVKWSGLILLQTIPDELNVVSLKSELTSRFRSILNVHSMHVWCLVPGNVVATMHVTFKDHQVSHNGFQVTLAHI